MVINKQILRRLALDAINNNMIVIDGNEPTKTTQLLETQIVTIRLLQAALGAIADFQTDQKKRLNPPPEN